jgi:hypothetical protein
MVWDVNAEFSVDQRLKSLHCRSRMQQRAIPDMIVTLLLDHGSRQRSHGSDLLFVDKSARKAIRRAVGGDRNMRLIEPFLNAKIVLGDDGTLITVVRQSRRIKRP